MLKDTNIFKYIVNESPHAIFLRWLFSHTKDKTADTNITACATDFLENIVQQVTSSVALLQGDNSVIEVNPAFPIPAHINQSKLTNKTLLELYNSLNGKYFLEIDFNPGQATVITASADRRTIYFKGMPLDTIKKIFSPYESQIANPIFQDYLNFAIGNSGVTVPPVIKPNPIITPSPVPPSGFNFPNKPFNSWDNFEYEDFFRYLIKSQLVTGKIFKEDYGYKITKGYTGIWWKSKITPEFPKFVNHNFYLEIQRIHKDTTSKVLLTVQISNYASCDLHTLLALLNDIYGFFKNNITDFKKFDWSKKRWVFKKYNVAYIWIGYVEFDENNYTEQITKMNDTYDKWIQTLP